HNQDSVVFTNFGDKPVKLARGQILGTVSSMPSGEYISWDAPLTTDNSFAADHHQDEPPLAVPAQKHAVDPVHCDEEQWKTELVNAFSPDSIYVPQYRYPLPDSITVGDSTTTT